MSNPVQVTINLDALRHNLNVVKKLAPCRRIIAMIKANAYGHGSLMIAKALNDQVEAFGVARLNEALFLIQHGITRRIFIFDGFFSEAELIQMAENNFTAIVHDEYQLKLLESTPLKKPLAIWLKLNTGMNRLGFCPEDFPNIYARALACNNIAPAIGLMSHFACADQPENPFTQLQLDCFLHLTREINAEKSCANSAALITRPDTHFDWVRPGIMLYGASPIAGKTGKDFNLKPVMTLRSTLIAIHPIRPGETVGYGQTFVCITPMMIGVVAMGYGDGFPRHIQNGTPVSINGKPASVAGRLSMDMMTIDLSNVPEAKIGDVVTFWGEELAAEIIADQANTISYELFCQVSQNRQRVEYHYQGVIE